MLCEIARSATEVDRLIDNVATLNKLINIDGDVEEVCNFAHIETIYVGNCQIKLYIGNIFVPASYRSNLIKHVEN